MPLTLQPGCLLDSGLSTGPRRPVETQPRDLRAAAARGPQEAPTPGAAGKAQRAPSPCSPSGVPDGPATAGKMGDGKSTKAQDRCHLLGHPVKTSDWILVQSGSEPAFY